MTETSSIHGASLLTRFSLLIALLLLGCTSAPDDDALVRVGKRVLTRAAAAELAGKPFDSLTVVDQWRLVNGWTETTLYQLEGERRKLDHDPRIVARLQAVEAELMRARILGDEPSTAIADSTVAAYYSAHRQEFLRTADSYLLDLYWSAEQRELEHFAPELARGDSTRLQSGVVSSLGKWLADRHELDPAVAAELSRMEAGAFSRPLPMDDGWRILRLTEAYPAGAVLDLQVVKGQIADRLLAEQGQARQDTLLSKLKARWPVELFLTENAETLKR